MSSPWAPIGSRTLGMCPLCPCISMCLCFCCLAMCLCFHLVSTPVPLLVSYLTCSPVLHSALDEFVFIYSLYQCIHCSLCLWGSVSYIPWSLFIAILLVWICPWLPCLAPTWCFMTPLWFLDFPQKWRTPWFYSYILSFLTAC